MGQSLRVLSNFCLLWSLRLCSVFDAHRKKEAAVRSPTSDVVTLEMLCYYWCMTISLKMKRKIAHALRHAPEQHGLTLDAAGRAELLDFSEAMGLTLEQILTVVEEDDKERFGVSETHIWARQGHSIAVQQELRVAEDVTVLFHGTKRDVLSKIQEEGLSPRGRQHVHMSVDEDTAVKVAARRSGESVILRIDAAAMMQEGFTIWVSDNGVFLADKVPPKFFLKISDVL